MRKALLGGVILSVAVASPAVAKPKPKPPKPAPSPYQCVPKSVGYAATGTLVTNGLTQTAGQSTPRTGDDRYSGELTVRVARVNHKAAKDEVTYTLDNARVRIHPRRGAVSAGDRVKVKGTITKAGKKCDTSTSTPTVTVRRVDIKDLG